MVDVSFEELFEKAWENPGNIGALVASLDTVWVNPALRPLAVYKWDHSIGRDRERVLVVFYGSFVLLIYDDGTVMVRSVFGYVDVVHQNDCCEVGK